MNSLNVIEKNVKMIINKLDKKIKIKVKDFIDVTLSSNKKADIVEMILDRKRKEIMKKNNDKKK